MHGAPPTNLLYVFMAQSLGSGTNLLNVISPLNAELNPICHLLALVGAHHILHVSRIRVNTVEASCMMN
jgi:hypothetical protein